MAPEESSAKVWVWSSGAFKCLHWMLFQFMQWLLRLFSLDWMADILGAKKPWPKESCSFLNSNLFFIQTDLSGELFGLFFKLMAQILTCFSHQFNIWQGFFAHRPQSIERANFHNLKQNFAFHLGQKTIWNQLKQNVLIRPKSQLGLITRAILWPTAHWTNLTRWEMTQGFFQLNFFPFYSKDMCGGRVISLWNCLAWVHILWLIIDQFNWGSGALSEKVILEDALHE